MVFRASIIDYYLMMKFCF